MTYITDMAIKMSNIHNFDIDQMSSKFAQRWHFVWNFCCKKISILGSIDNAENAKRQFFFFGHPIFRVQFIMWKHEKIDRNNGES